MSQSDSTLTHIHPQLRSLAIQVTDLVPDPKNARKHDRRNLDAIKASLERFGFRQPIVAQRSGDDLIVRAGNGRLQASIELGYEQIPVLVFAEGDDEAVAYAIADNRTAELAEWDLDVLAEFFGDKRLDLDGLGFSADEIGVLLTVGQSDGRVGGAVDGRPVVASRPDRPPEAALRMTNDRYQVVHGDMRSVLAGMESDSIDAIVCDPPYEINYRGAEWDRSGIAYDASAWAECLRVLKPGGHMFSFAACRTMHKIASAIEYGGFEVRDVFQWLFYPAFPKSISVGDDDEQVFAGYRTLVATAYEPIILARKPIPTTVAVNAAKHGTGGLNINKCRVPDPSDPDARQPSNVILGDGAPEVLGQMSRSFKFVPKASREERNAGLEAAGFVLVQQEKRLGVSSGGVTYNTHPTVKPVEIMQWLVKLLAPPSVYEPVVLDPFCGSGSTGVACVLEGVRFIGVELDEYHVGIARARIAEALAVKSGDAAQAVG